MKHSHRILMLVAILLGMVGSTLYLLPTPSYAAPRTTRCVAPGGAGGCYATIQSAINASTYGDLINVFAGTYAEHLLMRNGVSIYGAGWDTTVITGSYTFQTTIFYPAGIDYTTVLSGVRVTGGGPGYVLDYPPGGGIYVHNSSPHIINTWVDANYASDGGGIYVDGGSPTLDNVPLWGNHALRGGGLYVKGPAVVKLSSDQVGTDGMIVVNSADEGGAVYVENGQLQMQGIRLWWNSATKRGGALYATGSPSVTVKTNEFLWNSAVYGGGALYLVDSSILINGNGILSNRVTDAQSLGGGMLVSGSLTSGILDGNWLDSNSAAWRGGGIYAQGSPSLRINGNTVVYNTIDSALGGSAGGAGVMVVVGGLVTITNNIFARNVITPDNTISAGAGLGLISAPAKVINNTIADNEGNGLYFYGAAGTTIGNNIIWGNANHGIYGVMPSNYVIDYNDVGGNASANYQWVTHQSHEMSVNPLFVSTGNLKEYYHIVPLSPVRNTGLRAWAPPQDIDGEVRLLCASMGADQVLCPSAYLPVIIR